MNVVRVSVDLGYKLQFTFGHSFVLYSLNPEYEPAKLDPVSLDPQKRNTIRIKIIAVFK